MLKKNILIIEDTQEIISIVNETFQNEKSEYNIIHSKTDSVSITDAMRYTPDVVLINDDNQEDIYLQVTQGLESFMLPTICFSSEMYKGKIIDILSKGINQYIVKPVDKDYLYYTIKNYIRLMYNNRTVSPLTRITW